jgi:hypothetical protein
VGEVDDAEPEAEPEKPSKKKVQEGKLKDLANQASKKKGKSGGKTEVDDKEGDEGTVSEDEDDGSGQPIEEKGKGKVEGFLVGPGIDAQAVQTEAQLLESSTLFACDLDSLFADAKTTTRAVVTEESLKTELENAKNRVTVARADKLEKFRSRDTTKKPDDPKKT